MDWGILILDLILTVFGYLLVPVIFCIRNKPMSKKQINKIVYINGAVVWLIFALITGNPTSAVILWSWVGKKIMERTLLKEEQVDNVSYHSDSNVNQGGFEPKSQILFCRKCGNKLLEDSQFCNKCGTKVFGEEQ